MRKEIKINLSRECKDWTASLNIKMKKLKKRNEKNKEVINIPNNKKILLLMLLFKYNI